MSRARAASPVPTSRCAVSAIAPASHIGRVTSRECVDRNACVVCLALAIVALASFASLGVDVVGLTDSKES